MSPQYQAPPRSSPYMPPPNYAGVPAGAELAKGNMPVPSTGIQTYSCADHGAQRHSPNRTTQPPYRYPPDHPYHPPLWVESNNAEANAIGHVPPYRNIRPDFDRPPLHPERPQRRSLSDDTLMQPKMEPTKVERASEPPAIRAAARLPSADGDMDADSEGEGAEYSTVVPSSHQSGDAVQEGKRQSAGAANVGEGEESSSRVRKRKGSVGAGRRIRSTSASSKRKKLETTSSKERPTKEMHAAGHDEKETMKRAEVDMVMNGSQEKKVAPVPGGSVDSIEDASKSQIPETKINGSSMWAEALTDGGVKEESNGTENYGTDEQPIESNANHNSSSTSLPFDSGQPNVQYTRHGVGSLEVQMEFDMTSSEIDIMGVSPSPMHDAEEKFETSSIVSESAKIESPESATVSELVGIGSPAPGDYEPQPPSAPSSNSFCFCNGAVESTFYIGCDQCDQWFHGICVDVAESESRRLDKWYCSSCVEKSGGTLSAQYKRTCANPGCRRRANTDTGFCSGDCGRNWAFMRVQEVLPALKVDEDALDRARSKIEDYIDGWAALDTEIVNRLSFLRDFRGKVKQMLKVLDKRRDRVCEVASAVRETCGFDERILTWAEQTDMTIRRLLDLWIRAEEGAVEMMVEDTEMDVEFADVSEGVSTSPCDNVRGKCQMHERWTDVKIWEIDLESVQLVDFLNQLHNEEETVMERLKNFRESLPERGREVMLL
ncbi:hypothetical protein BJ742DRAFT_249717 [Cladochytrium replicatum]|nr:hypothetical protein BJ742DRAFT_249717 [Cladochytrium replicatum]